MVFPSVRLELVRFILAATKFYDYRIPIDSNPVDAITRVRTACPLRESRESYPRESLKILSIAVDAEINDNNDKRAIDYPYTANASFTFPS